MPLKLIVENPEKIRLLDPDRQNKLQMYIVPPLILILLFGPIFYFFGLFHPSYQIYCDNKKPYAAIDCRLKSTYFFIIPWYTYLGDVQYARFQINPSFRQNKVPNSCGEIALITGSATNPLSYEMEHQKQITFYLSCRNFTELKEIADGINNYLKQAEIKELKLPSLPRTWEQYLWTLGLIAAFLFNSKRIETCFDKSEELVTVKTIWVLHWTQTYPLKDVKKIVLHQGKDKRQHLIMNLTISRIDLGDVSDLDTAEQQHLCRAINNFLAEQTHLSE